MKRALCVAAVLFLLLPAGLAAAETKIGIVNLQQLIDKCEAGEQANQELDKKFESQRATLEKQQQDIQKLQEDLQKQSMVLSQEAKQDKEIEFKRKLRDFQEAAAGYERKRAAEQARLLKPILAVAKDVLQEFAKKNNFSMIMDGTLLPALLYADEALDVTKPLTAEINRAWRDRGAKVGKKP